MIQLLALLHAATPSANDLWAPLRDGIQAWHALAFDAEFSVLRRLFVSAATYGNQLHRPLRDLEHMPIPQLLQLSDDLPQYGIGSSIQLVSIPQ